MSGAFTFPDDVPHLSDDTVLLRAHAESDIPAIVQTCTDARNRRWLRLPTPYDDAAAHDYLGRVAQWWREDAQHGWAIDAAGAYAGSVNLHRRSATGWELGYLAHPAARGRGLITAAARLVVRHAFDDLGAATVTWRAGRGNWASRRVAWSAGFGLDGVWPGAGTDGNDVAQDLWTGHAAASTWTGEPVNPWWEPAVLEADGIRLRPWRTSDQVPPQDDAADILVATEQPTPERYQGWLLHGREQQACGAEVHWCIADADTDRPLGHLGLSKLDVGFIDGTGHLSYWLYEGARGRGVMSTALRLIRDHAFSPRTDPAGRTGLGLHRLEAGTDVRNLASARVLRRAGFVMWGRERCVLVAGAGHVDAANWELLATDDVAKQQVSPRAQAVIDTDRLRLRPWRDGDGERLPAAVDALAERFMPAGAQPTPDTFAAWLLRRRTFTDAGTAVGWCIADRADDQPLGDICLFGIGAGTRRSAEVGYWLLPAHRGRGYLAEALEAVLTKALAPATSDGYGLERIHAATDRENLASQALLRAAGLRKWGADRQAFTAASGDITDGAYFEVLATDDREAQRAVRPPVLDYPDTRLRPLRPSDASAVARSWADPQTARWVPEPDLNLTDAAEHYIDHRQFADESGRGIWWAICEPEGDEFRGAVGLQGLDTAGVAGGEVGYWLTPEDRGQGLAAAAVRTVASYAFLPRTRGGLGLERISAEVAEGNAASERVLQQVGFRPVGRARGAERLPDGSVVDLVLFDLLVDDLAGGLPT